MKILRVSILAFAAGPILVGLAMTAPPNAAADTIGPGNCGSCLGNSYTLTESNEVVGATTTTLDVTLTINSSGFNGFGTSFTGVGDLSYAAVKVTSNTSDVLGKTLLLAPGSVSDWKTVVGGGNAKGCDMGTEGFVCSQANFPNETDADLGGTLTFEWAVTVNNGTLLTGANQSTVKALFGCEDGTTENCQSKPQTSEAITLQASAPEASAITLTSLVLLAFGILLFWARRNARGLENRYIASE